MKQTIDTIKTDILAGLVVFLVALPLCLGIALASGAPLFSGIVAGVVGGLVIGSLSGSQVSVAGPAAGLTAIVVAAIGSLGSFENFLAAVIVAGVIQLLLGFMKAGMISSYLPSNVIEGMLAAIGIIIVMKQLPHAVGYRRGEEVDFAFFEPGAGHNSLDYLRNMLAGAHLGDEVICLVALAILIGWGYVKSLRELKAVPPALVAVVSGVVLNEAFKASGSSLAVGKEFLVSLPIPESVGGFFGSLARPNWEAFKDSRVWMSGATIAAVASIETLLCIEAADKMDPLKRYTDTNRELKAQGVGQIVSGLLGGIPLTSVIVRTTANIGAGARTKWATVAHGAFLLVAVLAIPALLNKIPLACLAAILLQIGFKLASPAKLRHMWEAGKYQFIPFVVTVLAVVFTDLLKGVMIGMVVSVLFILRANMKLAYSFRKESHHAGETIHIELAQEVSFLNKAAIKEVLSSLPNGSTVVINAASSFYIDHDVVELIKDFIHTGAKEKGISAKFVGYKHSSRLENTTLVSSH